MTEFSESLTDPFGGPADPWMAGRTALVTGGGQQSENEPGVGYAICRVFAAHGARVAVLDRDLAAAQRTVDAIEADGGTAVAVVADLLDDEACRRAVEETVAAFGGFDTLVNNVAVGDRAGVFEVTPERFHQLMDLNLTTAWQMTRHAVEVLPAGSAIVNISSVGVRARGPGDGLQPRQGGAGEPHRRRREHPRRPRHPGELRAGRRHLGRFAAANMSAEMRAVRKGWSALGTEGSPWDIAQATLFLSSERARWVSGQILSVDGGPSSPKPPRARPRR